MCWVFFKIICHRLKQIQSFHNSEKILFLLEFIFVHVYVKSKCARMCGQFCWLQSSVCHLCKVTPLPPKNSTKKSVPKQLSGGDYFVLETAASPKMYNFSFLNGGTLIV